MGATASIALAAAGVLVGGMIAWALVRVAWEHQPAGPHFFTTTVLPILGAPAFGLGLGYACYGRLPTVAIVAYEIVLGIGWLICAAILEGKTKAEVLKRLS
jgi:hypothetical protein